MSRHTNAYPLAVSFITDFPRHLLPRAEIALRGEQLIGKRPGNTPAF